MNDILKQATLTLSHDWWLSSVEESNMKIHTPSPWDISFNLALKASRKVLENFLNDNSMTLEQLQEMIHADEDLDESEFGNLLILDSSRLGRGLWEFSKWENFEVGSELENSVEFSYLSCDECYMVNLMNFSNDYDFSDWPRMKEWFDYPLRFDDELLFELAQLSSCDERFIEFKDTLQNILS